MEPLTRRSLHDAFAAVGATSSSPLYAALCEGLSRFPTPNVEELFASYYRVISAAHPDVSGFLAAIHHLALSGSAPGLARLFLSCGGAFKPERDQGALVQAAEGAVAASGDDVLDFMLAQEPRDPEIRRAAAVLLGALAAADRFKGGLSLVQCDAGDGLLLHFDRYAYKLGHRTLGDSDLLLTVAVTGSAPKGAMPVVVGRYGLDRSPVAPGDEKERLVTESFIPPDDLDRRERFRAACRLAGPTDLRRGVPEIDLAPLLTEAYDRMAPGNTLFLFSVLSWYRLESEAQKRVALAVQSLAARVQPRKPIAWLQVEPFTAGQGKLELRLHTFGWADLEDRAVRRLAEASPDLSCVTWLE